MWQRKTAWHTTWTYSPPMKGVNKIKFISQFEKVSRHQTSRARCFISSMTASATLSLSALDLAKMWICPGRLMASSTDRIFQESQSLSSLHWFFLLHLVATERWRLTALPPMVNRQWPGKGQWDVQRRRSVKPAPFAVRVLPLWYGVF